MARRASVALCIGVALGASACGGTLDAGRDKPHGLLPVDERNPVILDNDQSSDNWVGEQAVLLANNGGPPIAGIIASASSYWPVARDNAAGWARLVRGRACQRPQEHPRGHHERRLAAGAARRWPESIRPRGINRPAGA